jgi:HAE1 family hydrophobic/amphiphilic exporter-1
MATVFSLVILVIGSAFYTQLGLDQFPKVDLPIALVITTLPGASPEDIETEISDKIEGAVNTISGIEELRSVSSEGVSQVIIQFSLEKPVDTAVQEVRDKVSSILTELPRGIDPPVINKLDPDAQPVLYLALQAPNKSAKEITELADLSVRRRLESINGVGEVTISS